jgi:hypothetical protein
VVERVVPTVIREPAAYVEAVAVISLEILPGQIDEHGFQRGLGHRQVKQLVAGVLGRRDDLGQDAAGAFDMQLGAGVYRTRPRGAGHLAFQRRSQTGRVTGCPHRHDGVGSDCGFERGRSVQSQDAAVVHNGDAPAELVRLLHVVGGEEDCLTFAVERAQDVPQG